MKIIGLIKKLVGVLVVISTIGGFIVAIMQFNQSSNELSGINTQANTKPQTNTYVWENPDMFGD